MSRLRVTEIFRSLQGESASAGFPTTFVRLTGCPLRCSYCDTAYAFNGGQWLEPEQVLAEVAAQGVRHVCVTGGEPLAQGGTLALLHRLCDQNYNVSLETSGALDVSEVDPRVIKVLDLKSPGSGEQERNRYENLGYLRAEDQVKLVLCDRNDYLWAKEVIKTYHLTERCEVLVSPCYGRLQARQLADWVVEDRLLVRFQIQLHKYLWGDEQGR